MNETKKKQHGLNIHEITLIDTTTDLYQCISALAYKCIEVNGDSFLVQKCINQSANTNCFLKLFLQAFYEHFILTLSFSQKWSFLVMIISFISIPQILFKFFPFSKISKLDKVLVFFSLSVFQHEERSKEFLYIEKWNKKSDGMPHSITHYQKLRIKTVFNIDSWNLLFSNI